MAKRRFFEIEIPHIKFPEIEWEKVKIEIPEAEMPSPEEFRAECEGIGGRYNTQKIKAGETELTIHYCVKHKGTAFLIEWEATTEE